MKNIFFAASAAFLLAFAAFAAPDGTATRVEFTSAPEGATVSIDGKVRGVAPLALYDLAPGERHRATWTLDGYEPEDRYFTFAAGDSSPHHAELVPVKGIALVSSVPAGAQITLDGYALGETPRLLASLNAKDAHTLVLKKPGYQEAKTVLRFDGRNPVAVSVDLVLDSGTLSVTSEPSGAHVSVNGIPRGATPVSVGGIARGRASVVVSLQGYETVQREISVSPGDEQNLFVKLEEKPGRISVTSVPDGARIYVDGKPQGNAPAETGALKPGMYVVRAEMDGFAPVERYVRVRGGETMREEMRLESVLGAIEIRTSPPGAAVYVDGRYKGTTKSEDPSADTSDVLSIRNLKAGEHTLVVKRKGYAEVAKHPVVEAAKTLKAKVALKRVFTPDIRITTSTGVIEGVMVSSDPSMIIVETALGIERGISRDSIRKVERIGD